MTHPRPLIPLVLGAVLLGAVPARARPQAGPPPAGGVASGVAEARARLADGDWSAAAQLAGPLAHDASLSRADRAEAWRIHGLALFFLGVRHEAAAALHEYLKLEPDAHLDPALYPPEAIVFFEDVRAKHAGELRTLRPRPRRPLNEMLSFAPLFGQYQNGQKGKMAVLAAVDLALLGTNVATYVWLRRECDNADRVCSESLSPEDARTLKAVNWVSGVALAGTVVYGMLDGWLVYRKIERREATRFAVVPTGDGAAMVLGFTF